jgi:aminopeptidase N
MEEYSGYYIEKEYEPYAKQIYGNTSGNDRFFSKKMNYDYPWAKYAQISGEIM